MSELNLDSNKYDNGKSVFDEIIFLDPISGKRLEPVITARNPSGVPLSGALVISGTNFAYPIVDSVARITPELSQKYSSWLTSMGLAPVSTDKAETQSAESVESFGFQWTWNSEMRNDTDLEWRVCRRFNAEPSMFKNARVIDAGSGAGDQSRWILGCGAKLVSIDLSSAIDVVAKKLRSCPSWFGVQGDITRMPFLENQFDVVYCEGVIQHTRNSQETVQELIKVLSPNGILLATHYQKATRTLGIIREKWVVFLRLIFKNLGIWRGLLLAGNLAALAHIPIIGSLVTKSGTAVKYDLMPSFKSTWTNTYDNLGPHHFQRYISEQEFLSYFQNTKLIWNQGASVKVQKLTTKP